MLATFMLLLPVSCDKSRIYEKNVNIDKYVWNSSFVPTYTVNIQDTSMLYNIFVNVRHADMYPYQNIWLIVDTHFPSGDTASSRIEIMLANDEGKWYGEGLGDIWDFRTQIQENSFFRLPGTYTFSIRQNMRQDPLPGIMAVGLRVENTGMKRNNVLSTPRK